jgi:predicted CXXCH cytochrome family protein
VRKLIVLATLTGTLALGLWWLFSTDKAVQKEFRGHSAAITKVAGDKDFVGATACRSCHTEIFDLYSTSGHAHTFHSTTDSEFAQRLDGVEFHDPLREGTFRYHREPDGLSVSLTPKFENEKFPLFYALGSGMHGVSFLTLLPHRDGGTIGLEHRATFYAQKGGLDLTVGHAYVGAPVEDAEHFGRILSGQKLTQCIECHTTSGRVVHGDIEGLIPHVGCESCHGAGSHHIDVIGSGVKDPEYAAAKQFPDAMSELRTCGRCHRLPESIKKSELVRESTVLPRFQPAGLMQSLCFQKSEGAMRCTTCHDPHATVSKDNARYERLCLDCHQTQAVELCPQNSTNCIQCHMPPVSLEGVASFHDHWIRIRGEGEPKPAVGDVSVGH